MVTEASAGPLAGVKVVELGTLIAGPLCARMLADFGAEVIKIEAPEGGDQIRQWRKMYEGTSLWWYVQARNKKSVTLNLRAPEGQEIVRKLAREADIVVENFRPGALEKWNIGWPQLSALNPRLVMVRLSGFRTGRTRIATGPASASSPKRWAACATSPVIPIGRRCGSASRSATRSRRCTA